MAEKAQNAKVGEKTPKKTPKDNLVPPWKPGQSGNPLGRPIGAKNFDTLFKEAVRIVAQRQNISEEDPELLYVAKAIEMAMKGNFLFFNALTERRYGKVPLPVVAAIDHNVVVQVIPAVAQRYKIYDNTETNTQTGDNPTG